MSFQKLRWLVLGLTGFAFGQTCEESERQSPPEPECVVDDDCTLMPSEMTCCGECDPAPPFEAVPRTAVDSRLIELETDCAMRTRLCEPPVCEVPPPGCTAYASCIDGRCRAIESGCDVRLASTFARVGE